VRVPAAECLRRAQPRGTAADGDEAWCHHSSCVPLRGACYVGCQPFVTFASPQYPGHPGGTQREDFGLGAVDVIDGDVEVELLRATRVGEPWRFVSRGKLKGQPSPRGVGQHDPSVVLLVERAAEHTGVEGGQLTGAVPPRSPCAAPPASYPFRHGRGTPAP
jgi:hypothetical protein